MSGIITLTTDLGNKDAYAGILKGSLMQLDPNLNIIDISHEIPAGDVMAGGWVLKQAYHYFPTETVHLSVVGMNSLNCSHFLVIKYQNHFFVSPDNGLFSLVQEANTKAEIFHVNQPLEELSDAHIPTFILCKKIAPVCADLANGVELANIGIANDQMIRYKWAQPFCDRNGIQGMIHHVDHYGNLISNIDVSLFEKQVGSQPFKMYIGNTIIRQVLTHPTEIEDQECYTFKGSSGMMEIGVKGGNASELLSVQKGAAISVVLG